MRKPKFKKNELVKTDTLGHDPHSCYGYHLHNKYGIVLNSQMFGAIVSYSVYLQNGTSHLFYENELEKLTQ
jgi:hypothetical protein